MAEFFLSEEHLPEEHRSSVIQHLVISHQSVTRASLQFADELRRYYYVTPKNYLDFISNYRLQLASNGKQISSGIFRLEGGLQKLIEAANAVDRMQIVLSEKKVIVDEKTRTVQELIEQITEKSATVTSQQKEASERQLAAEAQREVVTSKKLAADTALEEALPAVRDAEKAVEDVDGNALNVLRSFQNPPAAVVTLSCMLVVLKPSNENLPESWEGGRRVFGVSNLKGRLVNYDKDKITDGMMRKIKKYIKDSELDESKMEKISNAAKSLFVWVNAMVRYYEIAKRVTPLRNEVATMETALAKTERS